jgi:hypothetical protein
MALLNRHLMFNMRLKFSYSKISSYEIGEFVKLWLLSLIFNIMRACCFFYLLLSFLFVDKIRSFHNVLITNLLSLKFA